MYRLAGKRLFDLTLAILGLIVVLPLLVLCALLIKFGSPGPVFFFHPRMGRGGKNFSLFKFRTMVSDRLKEGLGFEPGSQDRITPVGRILRATKLDELPQLINVLTGDMSFVGPRPESPKYREFYSGRRGEILDARPGITALSSIKYRNEEIILARSGDPETYYRDVVLPDKLELDLEYVQRGLGFWTDVRIIVATLAEVLYVGGDSVKAGR